MFSVDFFTSCHWPEDVKEMVEHMLFAGIDQDRYTARIDLGRDGRKEKDVVRFCKYGNAFTKNRWVDDKMIFVD